MLEKAGEYVEILMGKRCVDVDGACVEWVRFLLGNTQYDISSDPVTGMYTFKAPYTAKDFEC